MNVSSRVAATAVPTFRIAPRRSWFELNLGEFWGSRELAYFFVWKDIKVRYKQTAIGGLWAVLQPFLTMLLFSLFFGKLAKMPSDGLPYPVFFYSGLLPWMYFASAVQNATSVIVEQQRVITKVYFTRLVLPVSAVISPLLDFLVSCVMFWLIMLYYHVRLGMTVFLLPLFLALAVFTALGLGLWLSALNAMYRDVRYAIPFLIQFWMFASPVAYATSLVPERWRWLYGLNPMVGAIEGFRWALTGRGDPPSVLLIASVAAVGMLVVSGLWFFQRAEGVISDVV